jgi:hypothetical protein
MPTAMQRPFDSINNLRTAFVAGLETLLKDDGLGAYILVLANASFDPSIFRLLREPLARRFREHAERCRNAFAEGRGLEDAEDDLVVFLKLAALGFQSIGNTEFRDAGPWEVQFNLLRAFRPRRMSRSVAGGSQVPFDPHGFHFNKPFLRKETFWSGRLKGRSVELFYNKFPFVDLHGLLVPDREANHPQFLSRPYHNYAWELTTELVEALPGIGFGYNSYGAYASVNHLHFQMFVRERPLPLLAANWLHNGGMHEYPAPCAVFNQRDEAWRYLDHLHREEEPYNLLYLPGQVYCLPRARQGNYQHASWTGGFAWYEMSGGVVAFNRTDYERLDADMIDAELRRVGITD